MRSFLLLVGLAAATLAAPTPRPSVRRKRRKASPEETQRKKLVKDFEKVLRGSPDTEDGYVEYERPGRKSKRAAKRAAPPPRPRRGRSVEMSRRAAAAATWIVRGDESPPRPRRGDSVETSRRRGCDVDSAWRRVAVDIP